MNKTIFFRGAAGLLVLLSWTSLLAQNAALKTRILPGLPVAGQSSGLPKGSTEGIHLAFSQAPYIVSGKRMATGNIRFSGTVIASAVDEDTVRLIPNGHYSFTLGGAEMTKEFDGIQATTLSAIKQNGEYYGHYTETNPFGIITFVEKFTRNTNGEWTKVRTNNVGHKFYCLDVAYDPTSGYSYGLSLNDLSDGFDLYRLDYANGKAVQIGDMLQYNMRLLACSSSGQLYGIDGAGNLYRIDKNTGKCTEVGSTGYPPQYVASATIDADNNDMYWHICRDDVSMIVKVNLTSANSQVVHQFPYLVEIVGLQVESTFADVVPGYPTAVSATFPEGMLEGTVSFTMPAKLAGGADATGSANYTLKSKGIVLATGSADYGQKVTANVKLPQSGEQNIAIYASNDAGDGPASHWTSEAVGATPLPYLNDFGNSNRFSEMLVVDNNRDGTTWSFSARGQEAYCSYNASKAQDDWLFTPGFYLEAGKKYYFTIDYRQSFTSSQSASSPEKLRVRIGKSRSVTGMTADVISTWSYDVAPTCDLRSKSNPALTVSSSGIYYIGVQGCSDKDKYWNIIDNIYLSNDYYTGVPTRGSVNAENVTAGINLAKVSISTPTARYLDRETPLELTKVELYRNGELAHTFIKPKAASQIEYIDTIPERNYVKYLMVGYCMVDGKEVMGIPAVSPNLYLGGILPARISKVTLLEQHDGNGDLRMTWPTVDTDLSGSPIDPSLVHYMAALPLGNGNNMILSDSLVNPVIDVNVDNTDCDFYQMAAYPVTIVGRGFGTISNLTPTGPTRHFDFLETFANGQLHNPLAVNANGGEWGLYKASQFGIEDGDGNNGLIGFSANSQGASGTLYTHKIHIGSASSSPVASVEVYLLQGSNNENSVALMATDIATGNVDTIATGVLKNMGTPNTWATFSGSLGKYKGKTIMLMLGCKNISYVYNLFDHLVVTGTSAADVIDSVNEPSVAGETGLLRILNAEGSDVSVYNASGLSVGTVLNIGAEHTIALPRGIYLIHIGNRNYKAVVK